MDRQDQARWFNAIGRKRSWWLGPDKRDSHGAQDMAERLQDVQCAVERRDLLLLANDDKLNYTQTEWPDDMVRAVIRAGREKPKGDVPMILKIHNPHGAEERVVELALKQCSDGVHVCAVDPVTGTTVSHGNIATITQNRIMRFTGVDPALGFKLDRDGRLPDEPQAAVELAHD